MKSSMLFWKRCFATLAFCLLGWAPVSAQTNRSEPLRLTRFAPSSLRTSLTDAWTSLEVGLENLGAEPRQVRVVAFYATRPDVQYGREVWIPARSVLSTWMLVGPPVAPSGSSLGDSRDINIVLYDRTGGIERVVLPPGQERERARSFRYQAHGPFASVLLDYPESEVDLPAIMSHEAQGVLDLLGTFRQGSLRLYSEVVRDPFLPLGSLGLDGLEYVVIATKRVATDPPGKIALRRWLERGGTLWVMLDKTDPEAIAGLLGDDFPFEVVDRASVSHVQIISPALKSEERDPPLDLEEPVDFVRVVTTDKDTVLHTLYGWPASFVRHFGRGTVLYTTVGGRAWYRLGAIDYLGRREQSIPLRPLEELALRLDPAHESRAIYEDALTPLVGGEIGYEVPQRGTALVIFAVFLVTVLAIGMALRHWQRLELAGVFGPVAAIGAACVFIALGHVSRDAVQATIASAEIIDAAPGTLEQETIGRLAYYRPTSGSTPLGSTEGGNVTLDGAGLEGQTRRRIITDAFAWHWENLDTPTGLRPGSFRRTIATNEPIGAVAQFDADGISGQVSSGGFHDLTDAFIGTPTRQNLAVRITPGGRFTADSSDLLPPGQYLGSAVLTDRQQRRAAVYQRLMAESDARRLEGRTILYAWAEPPDALPFTIDPQARTMASSLLAIPVTFEYPPAGTRITVPSAFIPYVRIVNGEAGRPTFESAALVNMRLRFQLPPSVLPLVVERARLVARVHAPGRRFSVGGYSEGGKPVELWATDDPAGPVEVDVTQKDLLQLDARGGLELNVVVGKHPDEEALSSLGSSEGRWKMDGLALEVTGQKSSEK
jgi:hypothetical protein